MRENPSFAINLLEASGETPALERSAGGPKESPMQTPASFGEAERLLKSGTRLTPEQLASLLKRNPNTPVLDVLGVLIVAVVAKRIRAACWLRPDGYHLCLSRRASSFFAT